MSAICRSRLTPLKHFEIHYDNMYYNVLMKLYPTAMSCLFAVRIGQVLVLRIIKMNDSLWEGVFMKWNNTCDKASPTNWEDVK